MSVNPQSLTQRAPFPCSGLGRVEQTLCLQQFHLSVCQLRTNLLLLMIQGKKLQAAVAAWGAFTLLNLSHRE